MSSEEKKPETEEQWTLMSGQEYAELIDEAQRLLERMTGNQKINLVAAAFAGVALIRMCADRTNGSIEWWCDYLRDPESVVRPVHVPPGTAVTRNTVKGKQ